LAGGAIALTNGFLLARRMRFNRRKVGQSAQRHLLTFYLSGVERFFAVLALFALSLGPLNLKPLPLIVGFVLGQLALVFSTLILRKIE
jgi:ATP synthase protein I